ncbi:putative G-protein coupled receptor 19 [Oculina patagonica]
MKWKNTESEIFTDFVNETMNGDEHQSFEDNIFNTLSVVRGILVVCGILENAVICWILIRKRKCFKSFSNFHLLSLAITDILFRIIFTPDLLQQFIGGSDLKCKIGEFGKFTTLAVTFAILAGIAFDRYIHIVQPFRARTVTWKHSRKLIALSWIYGTICSAPFLYSTKCEVFDDEETMKKFWNCYDVPGLPFRISITVFFGCSFIIPLVFMAAVYSKIVNVLWSRARKNTINKTIAKAKFQAVKMMAVIVLTYLFTWGPKLILKVIEAFHVEKETFQDPEGDLSTSFLLSDTFETLSLASSVFNPLIFSFYNGSFRQELKSIFWGIKGAKCFRKRISK